jgi:RimJ/RimL family protein N-acetyltransferase
MVGIVHELPSGLRVTLRLAKPSDAPRVRAFFERLSPDTLTRRFFTPMPKVPERTIEHFTFYDPRKRMVFAATVPAEGVEQIVGLADIALSDTGTAELGLVVDDDHQGQGVGHLLAGAIASLAVKRGATHLKAEMLDGNSAMLAVMESLGPVMHTVEDGHRVAFARLPR